MKGNHRLYLAAILAALPCATSAQTLVTERTLSVNAAMEMATAALEACRKHETQVTITVLDHAGRTKVVLRDDGANPHSVEHSLRKAYTALTYRMPSSEYGKRAAGSFPASAGGSYVVESLADLESDQWRSVPGSTISSAGWTAQITVPIRLDRLYQFYRVRIQP